MTKSRRNGNRSSRSIGLSKQIQELRIQLAEAEGTIEAIRTGGVDALIVNGPQSTQIYTLQGADYGYQVMIENMSDGAVTVSHQGHILYANRGFAEIVGRPLQKVIGATLSDFAQPKDVERLENVLALGQQNLSRTQLTLCRPPSGKIPVEMIVNILPNGSSPNLCVIFFDVSERNGQLDLLRRQEAELHQARKMEVIGRLAGGVAHEFNNLIAGIMGISSELKSSMQKSDSRRADVEEIIKASQRAFTITKQLLAFGRREVVQARVMNVDHVIRDLGRMLKRLIREDVSLTFELGGAGHVCIDPGHLEQVILNLVINARDAMPTGGRLRIRTWGVSLQEKEGPNGLGAGSYAVLEVIDNGVGMTEETFSHIFEPFFTTKEKEHGTGLGLATVYGIVKQNSGEIIVESKVGVGSVFRIYFPNVLPVQDAVAAAPEDVIESERGTVLVVEDESIIRRVVGRALQRAGYTVLEASHGVEAIALSTQSQGPIDLILADIMLSGMNGKEIADAVCQRHPEARVLFMSGYPEDVISDKGILRNGVSFIEKCDLRSQLIPRVRDLLKHPVKHLAQR